jgi:hypothetical protein
MAKEVLSLGGTSRRIRAVLVHAGLFSNISLQLDVDQLFATSVIATDGFLENVKWVPSATSVSQCDILIYSPRILDLSLFYRGPKNQPVNAASLRRALDLYSGSEEIVMDWDVTYASAARKSLPPLPPTRTPTLRTSTSKPQTLHLLLRDNNPQHLRFGTDPTVLISRHLSQLLSVVASSGLKKIELVTHLPTSKIAVSHGFSVFGDSLRGITCEGLARLGITYPHSVDSKRQISESWVGPRRLTSAAAHHIHRCSSQFSKNSSCSHPAFHRHSATFKSF